MIAVKLLGSIKTKDYKSRQHSLMLGHSFHFNQLFETVQEHRKCSKEGGGGRTEQGRAHQHTEQHLPAPVRSLR